MPDDSQQQEEEVSYVFLGMPVVDNSGHNFVLSILQMATLKDTHEQLLQMAKDGGFTISNTATHPQPQQQSDDVPVVGSREKVQIGGIVKRVHYDTRHERYVHVLDLYKPFYKGADSTVGKYASAAFFVNNPETDIPKIDAWLKPLGLTFNGLPTNGSIAEEIQVNTIIRDFNQKHKKEVRFSELPVFAGKPEREAYLIVDCNIAAVKPSKTDPSKLYPEYNKPEFVIESAE